VPTTDSVRTTYLLDLLAPRGQHVLLCGPTGTGKTINISQYLMGQVSANLQQYYCLKKKKDSMRRASLLVLVNNVLVVLRHDLNTLADV
jgi:KaiC/GvpD/RAD55 family RecA-like ATPase